MKAFKKLAIAILVLIAGFGISNAQFRFGIKAGLNVNSLHLNDIKNLADDNNRAGWTAGVMTEFQVPIIGLCLDASVMYTRMNSDINYFVQDAPENMMYKASIDNKNFINIPINIKYKFSLPVVGSFLAPYLYTGPDFAFKLDKNTFKDLKTRTCQIAWNVGLGIELLRHLQLQASYGFGINNIADHWDWVNNEDFKVRNNYWTVTAAYLF